MIIGNAQNAISQPRLTMFCLDDIISLLLNQLRILGMNILTNTERRELQGGNKYEKDTLGHSRLRFSIHPRCC